MPPPEDLLQKHTANLSHVRDTFPIDARKPAGAVQVAPWISRVVQLVHPAIEGAFQSSNPQVNTFANPAAGAPLVITIPPNEAWLLRSLKFDLVTDANAANRLVELFLDDTASVFFQLPAESIQIASTTRRYTFGRGVGYQARTGIVSIHGLPDLTLDPGWRIQGQVDSIQVGDQISAAVILVDVFAR